MWIYISLLFISVLVAEGKIYYDEEWGDRTVNITVKTDLNFKGRGKEFRFDRKVDCPEVLSVTLNLEEEDVELELYLNKLLEPEKIPIFVGRNNKLKQWSQQQEKRRETCYYQDSREASVITIEYDFGFFNGKMSGSFDTPSGSYEFIQDEEFGGKSSKSSNGKYKIRKVVFEGSYDVDYGANEVNYVPVKNPREKGGTGSDKRAKRNTPTPNYIEIMAVIDFSLYSVFYERTDASKSAADREADAMSELRYEFSHVYNGVDTRYSSISIPEYSYTVILSGITIATDAASSPYTETLKQPGTPRDKVDIIPTLESFLNWTKDNAAQFTDYDHIQMFSEYDFFTESNTGVQGLSFVGEICTESRVSIVEHEGIKVVTQVAAHEMGHNLGARHDQIAGCNDADNYIMRTDLIFTSGQTGNLCCFSTCSISAIKSTTDSLVMNNANCMVNPGDIYNTTDNADNLRLLPGLRYSRDQQCVAITGDSGAYFEGVLADICTTLQCFQPSTNKLTDEQGRALDYTTCGNRMWCVNYQCVQDDNAPFVSLDEQCQSAKGDRTSVYGGGQELLGEICSNIYCYTAGVFEVLLVPALEFSTCGNNKWCVGRQCVNDASAPTVSDCEYGDLADVNGQTCAQIIAEDPLRCGQSFYSTKCCKTCEPPTTTSSTQTTTTSNNQATTTSTGQTTTTSSGETTTTSSGQTTTTSSGETTTTSSGETTTTSSGETTTTSSGETTTTSSGQTTTTSSAQTTTTSSGTTRAPNPGTTYPVTMKMTFSASKCSDSAWKSSLISTLSTIFNQTVALDSCTTGSSVVVFIVEHTSPVTDADRTLAASKLRNAINNDALTINGNAFTLEGQPVVINGNTEATICSYQESESLCISGTCTVDSNNKLVCKTDDNNSTWILVGSIIGAVVGVVLVAILVFFCVRCRGNILQPTTVKKRRYTRTTHRYRTRPVALPEARPVPHPLSQPMPRPTPQPFTSTTPYGYFGQASTQPWWTKPVPTRVRPNFYSQPIVIDQWTSKATS